MSERPQIQKGAGNRKAELKRCSMPEGDSLSFAEDSRLGRTRRASLVTREKALEKEKGPK